MHSVVCTGYLLLKLSAQTSHRMHSLLSAGALTEWRNHKNFDWRITYYSQRLTLSKTHWSKAAPPESDCYPLRSGASAQPYLVSLQLLPDSMQVDVLSTLLRKWSELHFRCIKFRALLAQWLPKQQDHASEEAFLFLFFFLGVSNPACRGQSDCKIKRRDSFTLRPGLREMQDGATNAMEATAKEEICDSWFLSYFLWHDLSEFVR